MSLLWSNRDLDIVETLTRRVRLLSVEQAARIWWAGSRSLRVVRRRLRKLAGAGLIERRVVNVGMIPQQPAPLIRWSPGEPDPDAVAVADQARGRWRRGAVPQEVMSATRLAANLFGGSTAGLPPVHHRDHDLLLAEVYVLYRTLRPHEAEGWRSVDGSPAGSLSLQADAILVDARQHVIRAIESAGRCESRQIVKFHERCVQAALPYELW